MSPAWTTLPAKYARPGSNVKTALLVKLPARERRGHPGQQPVAQEHNGHRQSRVRRARVTVITHNSRSRRAGPGHPPLLDLYEHRVFGIDKLNDRRAGNL